MKAEWYSRQKSPILKAVIQSRRAWLSDATISNSHRYSVVYLRENRWTSTHQHRFTHDIILFALSMSPPSTPRPLAVIAGIGNGAGTGAASAWVLGYLTCDHPFTLISRLFARQGYSIALIARSRGDSLTKLVNEIKETGGDVKKYLISSCHPDSPECI